MESYKAFSGALRKYRTTADYTEMISVVADLFTDDPNKYPLLRSKFPVVVVVNFVKTENFATFLPPIL